MSYSIVFNGTSIPPWSSSPPVFNGTSMKKVYFNGNYVYNWLSMAYTKSFPYVYGFDGSWVGYSGAYVSITRHSSTQYKLYLYVADMAADYTWRGYASSATGYYNYGTSGTLTIRHTYGRDQPSLRAVVSFENSKLVIRGYRRSKDYKSFGLFSTSEFEG